MRKTDIVTISGENRDSGKTFLLTEMPASQAERWATRAMLSMGRAGIEMPADLENTGMAGIATVGIRALVTMDFTDAEALLDEMMDCIQIVPDPAKPQVTRALVESDIEEVQTRLRLRGGVIALHLGFSIADALSKLGALAKMKLGPSQNTETSPEPSAPLSQPDSPA